MKQDKISVVIPTYKREKHFLKCLQSVIDQTYKNIEIIIADNSDDSSILDVVNAKSDERIKYYKNTTNIGCNANYRKVISLSNGTYLFTMASDNYLDKNCLNKLYSFSLDHNRLPFVSAQTERVVLDENMEVVKYFNDIKHNIYINENLLEKKSQIIKSQFLIEQMLIRKKPFQMVSFFESLINTDYLKNNEIPLPASFGWQGMEYPLTLNTLLHTPIVGYIDEILIYGIYNDEYFDNTVRPIDRYIPYEKVVNLEKYYYDNRNQLTYLGLNPIKIELAFIKKYLLFITTIDKYLFLAFQRLIVNVLTFISSLLIFIFTLPISLFLTVLSMLRRLLKRMVKWFLKR